VTSYLAEHAWLPTGVHRNVRIEVAAGRITAVSPDALDAEACPGDQRLSGLTVPGFANTHSHAFHRALRGRTHEALAGGGGGTFWTWRERMYEVASRLDPDSYLALARAVYAEMALAGITAVGEFHYLHHAPGGARYADPNAMGMALLQAAADAGIRIALLDTCYLTGGLGPAGPLPLAEEQLRFSDGDADRWATRLAGLRNAAAARGADSDGGQARIGAAIHSVRAVPRAALGTVVEAAAGGPLHVHLSEQPAENDQCQAVYGMSPTRLLAESGALGAGTTAVHATHLSGADIAELGGNGTTISMCPTTERDLADGIGPARVLADAGARITLGSDQHAVVDLLEEARALEMDERLASGQRRRFRLVELLGALTGHHGLGWDDAGELRPGARADLVTIALDTVRTAGCAPEQALLAATAADVRTVLVDGTMVVDRGRHHLGDVGALLAEAIAPLWSAEA
jgi:formiminoglutamate deiminase